MLGAFPAEVTLGRSWAVVSLSALQMSPSISSPLRHRHPPAPAMSPAMADADVFGDEPTVNAPSDGLRRWSARNSTLRPRQDDGQLDVSVGALARGRGPGRSRGPHLPLRRRRRVGPGRPRVSLGCSPSARDAAPAHAARSCARARRSCGPRRRTRAMPRMVPVGRHGRCQSLGGALAGRSAGTHGPSIAATSSPAGTSMM